MASDRYNKSNEESSCWVRVSQAWAGTGFGNIAIPRVGQEVKVDFPIARLAISQSLQMDLSWRE